MILKKFEKQPADLKDYDNDYQLWLVDSDTISSVTAVPDVDTINVDSVFHTLNRVKVWLSGGIADVVYKITVTINTEDGRVLQHEFVVKVRDR